jgi:hypothetical protein
VKDAPPYDSAIALDRDEDFSMHKHHEGDEYGADEVKLDDPLAETFLSASAHRQQSRRRVKFIRCNYA